MIRTCRVVFLTAIYGVIVSAFLPAHHDSKIIASIRPSVNRFDTRQYGLFGNRAASSLLLANGTDSDNYSPLNQHLPNNNNDDKNSSNNTSTAVLDVNINGEEVTIDPTEMLQAVVPPPTNGNANQPINGRDVPPPFYREGTGNPSGIGGQGGVTYNVNALKRNLLQETIRAYKMELLTLLQSPSATEHVIAEKLAALVQSSPVRTTTDSNLLQGEGVHWTLCYQSKFSTVAHLKRPPPPLMRNDKKVLSSTPPTPDMRRVAGKELSMTRSRQRSFHLESLPDDQDPCVVDHEYYWGGLIRIKRTYAIKALTRTSLNIQLQSNRRWVLGRERKQHSSQGRDTRNLNVASPVAASLPLDMTIIYSDTDLCIIADPEQRTYQVYTQAEAWQSTRLNRQIRFSIANLWYRLTLWGGASARQQRTNARLLKELQRHQDLLDEESRLIVWQLGAGDNDEEAWESRTDPFVHLSADDRQRILKAMSVRQVREAGQEYVTLQKRARFFRFPWLSRRTHFTSPTLERQRKTDRFRRPEE